MPEPPIMPRTAFAMKSSSLIQPIGPFPKRPKCSTILRRDKQPLFSDGGSDRRTGRSQGSSMPSTGLTEKCQSIIDACPRMNELGINQGTSGNISLRHEAGLLITPTSVPYEAMQPEQIVFMDLGGSFDPR